MKDIRKIQQEIESKEKRFPKLAKKEDRRLVKRSIAKKKRQLKTAQKEAEDASSS